MLNKNNLIIIILVTLLVFVFISLLFIKPAIVGWVITRTSIINSPPVINLLANYTINEDELWTLNDVATDVDQDPLMYLDNTSLFDINPSTGAISYTPTTSQEAGNYTIKITVVEIDKHTDELTGYYDSKTFILTVNAVNDAPILDYIGKLTVETGSLSTYQLIASDEESTSLIYSSNESETFISLNSQTGLITFDAISADTGTYFINFSVTDDELSDSEVVELTVLSTNRAPGITSYSPISSSLSMKEDNSTTFSITATDPDGTIPSTQWYLNGVALANEINQNYTFIGNFTDKESNAGTHTVSVIVTDNLADEVSHSWELIVNRTRDADGDNIPNYRDDCPFDASNSCSADDSDGDGVNDSNDFVSGTINFVETNVPLRLKINETTNPNEVPSGTLPVELEKVTESGTMQDLVIFEFTFSNDTKLDLGNIIIKEDETNNTAGILVFGIDLTTQGKTKTIYLNRLDSSKNAVCIEDKEIASITELTSDCSGSGEEEVECDGTTQNGYICTYNSSSNYYKIQGLSHSGIRQISYTQPEAPSPAGAAAAGGGGGGGGAAISVPTPKPTPKPPTSKPTEEAKEVLFDIILDLIKSKIFAGEDLNVKITLINFGVPGRVNVSLYYAIKDSNNNAVLKETETTKVETQKEFIKTFKLPSGIAIGDYTISAELRYDNITASSSASFEIIKKPIEMPSPLRQIQYLLLIIIIILIVLILHKKYKTKKIEELIKKEKKFTRNELDKQLQILKTDLDSGYITKDTYDKQKKKIEKLMKKGGTEK